MAKTEKTQRVELLGDFKSYPPNDGVANIKMSYALLRELKGRTFRIDDVELPTEETPLPVVTLTEIIDDGK